jgi:hypothetical protein
MNLKIMLVTTALYGTLLSTGANAASIVYNLNLNNAGLPAATYVTVTLADSATPGGIDVTFDALTPPFVADTNFGIQSVGFNGLQLSAANFTNLASGWTFSAGKNQDGFGTYLNVLEGSGSTRQDPLTFTIVNAGDTINSYASNSTGGNSQFFAAHVAGIVTGMFDDEGLPIASAFFAGHDELTPPSEVPVPAAAWLLGSGLLNMIGVARRKAA